MSTAIAGINNLSAALQNVNRHIQDRADVSPILNYKSDLRENGWVVGQGQEVVSNFLILVHTPSIQRGMIAFKKVPERSREKRTFEGEILRNVFNEVPVSQNDVDELKERIPYEVTLNPSCAARAILDPFAEQMTATQVKVSGNSVGMNDAFNNLLSDIIQVLQAGEETYINPLCQLQCDHYEHPTRGNTIFVPKLNIKDWCDTEGTTKKDTLRLEDRI